LNRETTNGSGTSAEQVLSTPGEEPAAAVSGSTLETRKLRLLELALVLSIAFLVPTLNALSVWWTEEPVTPDTGYDNLIRILRAALAISVLAYVLYRQGRSLRTIGLTAKVSDIPWALTILVCSKLLASSILNLFVAYHVPESKAAPSPEAAIGFMEWLAVVPGAALEELIVRAYLMTEVAALSGSMALAVIVSVGFQCFYHVYQGVPTALYHAGAFFVYAVFYAQTRRATPVILAHALANFLILAE
jgi:membrane protease YdiL (CAAX protease family)